METRSRAWPSGQRVPHQADQQARVVRRIDAQSCTPRHRSPTPRHRCRRRPIPTNSNSGWPVISVQTPRAAVAHRRCSLPRPGARRTSSAAHARPSTPQPHEGQGSATGPPGQPRPQAPGPVRRPPLRHSRRRPCPDGPRDPANLRVMVFAHTRDDETLAAGASSPASTPPAAGARRVLTNGDGYAEVVSATVHRARAAG